MQDRNIAILNFKESNIDNVKNTVNFLKKFGKITVFSFFQNRLSDLDGIEIVSVSEDLNTEPKRRNWVNRYFRQNGFTGFLHVLTDSTLIKQNPFVFINDIETMMSVLDYNVWFNTVCDGCNYVYNKYNPRIYIDIDIPEIQTQLAMPSKINLTSHSNQQWIIYDYSNINDDLLTFSEDFTIAMFWIIEFLARRRNTKSEGSLYFMNYYLTVESEYGVFGNLIENNPDNQIDSNQMKNEDTLFKQKNIKFEPDSNIDMILETFWNKINLKMKK